jgi:hypothetical protein
MVQGLSIGALVLLVVVLVIILLSRTMRRSGYDVGRRSIMKCREDHLFVATLIPGVSFVSLRLGPTARYRHCPVGHHFSLCIAQRRADLNALQIAEAESHQASFWP